MRKSGQNKQDLILQTIESTPVLFFHILFLWGIKFFRLYDQIKRTVYLKDRLL